MYANIHNVDNLMVGDCIKLRTEYYSRLVPEIKYKDEKDKVGTKTGYHLDPRYPNLKFKLK